MRLVFAKSFFPGLYNGICDGNGKCDFNSLYQLPLIIANVIQILLAIIAGLAVIFIMYSGILYITSGGDPQRTAAAKTAITNAIIGLLLSSSAFLILQFITSRF